VPIDLDLAKKALAPLAEQAGISVERAAWGIHDVVNENMAGAARVHIAERGKDPRNYAILPTGGAGPVHAYYVARKLGLRRLICPPAAGVASALGLLMAPARIDRAVTRMVRIAEADWGQIEQEFDRLADDALSVIQEVGIARDMAVVQRHADIRYVGQGFEVVVKLPPGPYDAASAEAIVAAFKEEYLKVFAHIPPSGAVEIVNLRVSAIAPIADQDVVLHGFGQGKGMPRGKRDVFFPELNGFAATDIYNRYELPAGFTLDGPAVIEERESTLIVGPGGRIKVHESGSLIITLPTDTGGSHAAVA
jgi:N-methylhydantoinase A